MGTEMQQIIAQSMGIEIKFGDDRNEHSELDLKHNLHDKFAD